MKHRRVTELCTCCAIFAANTAQAVPPPPPPPEEWAKIVADCRTPASRSIPLTRTTVPVPKAPAELNIGWGLRVAPTTDAEIGRLIGVTTSWNGSIIAATDRGYWLRIPSADDEAGVSREEPIAVSIRNLAGTPQQMAFAKWSGEPGYVGLNVLLAVDGAPALLNYEVGGCFPGAKPIEDAPIPQGTTVARLEPGTDARPGVILREATGNLSWNAPRTYAGGFEEKGAVSKLVAQSTASISLALAKGCDQLTFHRTGTSTIIRSSCSSGYLTALKNLWSKPQKQHRQPSPISKIRTIGAIEAPVVAVSDARPSLDWMMRRANQTVAVGDKSDPGRPCSFIIAAQEKANAPIIFYGAQPYCAYYPRSPDGAPFPPPPPPS